jgi:hypothetical protein
MRNEAAGYTLRKYPNILHEGTQDNRKKSQTTYPIILRDVNMLLTAFLNKLKTNNYVLM